MNDFSLQALFDISLFRLLPLTTILVIRTHSEANLSLDMSIFGTIRHSITSV